MSTKQLSDKQKEQILVGAGLISTNESISGTAIQRAFVENGVNDEIASQILGEKGLINVKTGEIIASNTLTEAELREALAANGIVGVKQDQIIKSAGVTAANGTEALSWDALTASIGGTVKMLWTFLTTNPVGWAILAGTAIFAAAKAYDAYNKKQEEAIQKARELQEEYHKQSKETSDHIKSLNDQKDEFERLSKGVDDYGNNISLSTDEYERYKEIVSEILGYSPDLISGYDEEGNAIARKNGLIEKSIELMQEEQRERLKELTSKENTTNLYNGVRKDYKDLSSSYPGVDNKNELVRLLDDNKVSSRFSVEAKIAEVLGILEQWQSESTWGGTNRLEKAVRKNIDTVTQNIKDNRQALLDLKDPREGDTDKTVISNFLKNSIV